MVSGSVELCKTVLKYDTLSNAYCVEVVHSIRSFKENSDMNDCMKE